MHVYCKFDIVYTQHWLTEPVDITEMQATVKEWTQYAFYDSAGFQFEKSSKFNDLEMHERAAQHQSSATSTNRFSFIQHFGKSVCFWKLIFHRFGIEYA